MCVVLVAVVVVVVVVVVVTEQDAVGELERQASEVDGADDLTFDPRAYQVSLSTHVCNNVARSPAVCPS